MTIMLSEELRPYRKALIDAGMKESVGLVQDLEGDPRAEIQRLDAYIALAKLQHDGGDPAGAASTIGKAVALAESLLARDPSSARARRTLAASLHIASVVLPDEVGTPRICPAVRSRSCGRSRRRAPALDPMTG